jgi:hypothetical protein
VARRAVAADADLVKAGLAALALCAIAASCALASPAADDPAVVARSYYAAYNKKDGKTMCRLFTTELNQWFMHLPGLRQNLGCAKTASAFIGYGEESDTPLFRRLKILSVAQKVDGDEAQVTIRARFNYKHFPKPVSVVFTDRLYLVKRGSSWRVAKPGGVWFLTASAYNTPETMLDPPVTDGEAHVPAPQIPATFDCTGKAAALLSDPPGDALASLDVRRVNATVEGDNSICLRVAFEAAPRPGTVLTLRAEEHTPGQSRFRVADGAVRVGHNGVLYSSLKAFRGGWRDGELLVRFAATTTGEYTVQLGGATKTLQYWEPFVHGPLLGRGDEPYDGLGDSFGRPAP